MGTPLAWLADTFSSASKEGDGVATRSLNSTRITAVILPILTGVWTAISELADTAPFNDEGFQRVLIVAGFAFIAVVVVADMFVRAISANRRVPVATPLPAPLVATWVREGEDAAGRVVAFRAGNAERPTTACEYLFVPDGGGAPAWVLATELSVSG